MVSVLLLILKTVATVKFHPLMKNHHSLLFYFFCILIFTSCGGDGLKLFDKDIRMTNNFDIAVPDNSPVKTLTISKIYDATTEPGLMNIVDRIDKYILNSISYSITNYIGEPTNLKEGTIRIESVDGALLGHLTLTNIELNALNDAGEQMLIFTPEEISNMEDAFLADNMVNFIISATIDNDPVSFTLTTNIDFTVEYRVLD